MARFEARPNTRTSSAVHLVWLFPLVSVLFTVGAVRYFWLSFPVTGWDPDTVFDPLGLVFATVYPLLGALIVSRRPANSTGWLFCLMGLVAGLYQFSMQYSIYAYRVLRQPLPLAAEMSWVQSWAWFVPLMLILLLVMQFPDGKPLSPRWKPVSWALSASIFLLIAATYLILWPYRGEVMFVTEDQMSEAAQQSQRVMRSLWVVLVGFPFFAGVPLAVFSLLSRLRRAAEVEKQQIKWFMYAGGVFSATLVLSLAFMLFTPTDAVGALLWNTLLPVLAALIPLSVAFGILRYRLYDIDLIIRRTLVYSVVTTILAVIYLGSVVLFQTIIRTVTGDESTLAVVASTLLIAALFNPLRQRLQYTLDRRFFRSRYSPERLVSNLTAALQSEVDVDRLAQSVLETVDTAVRPENLSLWLLKTVPAAELAQNRSREFE